jgi:hypothetical protein
MVSICVVGNGPSVIGSRNGKVIDSHDHVYRFNEYVTDGFELDVGVKTTHWSINQLLQHTTRDGVYAYSNVPACTWATLVEGLYAIYWITSWWLCIKILVLYAFVFVPMSLGRLVLYGGGINVPHIHMREMVHILELYGCPLWKNPSSGFMVCASLYLKKHRSVTLIGCDNITRQQTSYRHYYGQTRVMCEDFDYERRLILKFADELGWSIL